MKLKNVVANKSHCDMLLANLVILFLVYLCEEQPQEYSWTKLQHVTSLWKHCIPTGDAKALMLTPCSYRENPNRCCCFPVVPHLNQVHIICADVNGAVEGWVSAWLMVDG